MLRIDSVYPTNNILSQVTTIRFHTVGVIPSAIKIILIINLIIGFFLLVGGMWVMIINRRQKMKNLRMKRALLVQ